MMAKRKISRRDLILAGGTVLGLFAGGAVLQACGGAAAPASSSAAASSSAPSSAPAASAKSSVPASAAKLEKTSLKIGIPLDATTLLPLYLAQEQTFKEEGLTGQIFPFRGDAEVAQALASDSVDFNLASMNGLINMINAGQPVKGFYAGFDMATFSWYAQPQIKTWADLKGKTLGVSTFGALTDFLTRYVLRKHQLEPEKDVQIVQAGGSPQSYPAMKAGRLSSAILAAPFSFQAKDEGFTLLGTQKDEVNPTWPYHIYFAKEKFINDNPRTIEAVLRAHVRALRLAKAQPKVAIDLFVNKLKYPAKYGQEAYDEVVPNIDEKGLLPEKAMPIFWQTAVASGDVKEPWPNSKFLDSRFIDSFNKWAPK